MALVKFYKGKYESYKASEMTDGVYFAEDKHVIRLNGVDYGGLDADVFQGIVGNLDLKDSKLTYQIYTTSGTWEDKTITLNSTDIQREETESGDTKVAVTGTTVEQAIESLATSIKTVDDNVATYSIKKITGDTLAANVKEAYQLYKKTKNSEETPVDVQIPIYKDSALKSITLESEDDKGKKGQFLKYVYTTEEGEETTVYLDCSKLVVEAEFKNGLTVSDEGEVSVKVEEVTGETNYLSVSENGVKVSGVDKAISDAVAQAKTELIGGADEEYDTMGEIETKVKAIEAKAEAHTVVNAKADGHVTVTVESKTTADGVSYSDVTVAESDIASDNGLQAEITRAKAAEDKIESSVGLAEDGSHVTTTGNYTSAATTVVEEIAALDTQVKKNADEIAALDDEIKKLDVAEIGGDGKVITKISETDGLIAATAIDLTASNVAFTAITGDTASVDVDATQVQDAIASLAKSIKTLETYLTWNEVE